MTAIRYFTQEGGRFTVATGRPTAPSPLCPSGPHQRPGGAVQRGGHLRLSGRPAGGAELAGRVRSPDLGAVLDRFPSLSIEAYHGEDIYIWNPTRSLWPTRRRSTVTIPCVQWSRFPPLGKGPVSPRPRDLLAARAFSEAYQGGTKPFFQ